MSYADVIKVGCKVTAYVVNHQLTDNDDRAQWIYIFVVYFVILLTFILFKKILKSDGGVYYENEILSVLWCSIFCGESVYYYYIHHNQRRMTET